MNYSRIKEAMSMEIKSKTLSTKGNSITPPDAKNTDNVLTGPIERVLTEKTSLTVDQRLNLQSALIKRLNLSVEVKRHQEKLLQALDQKIKEKKKEFEELIQHHSDIEGEKLDLNRALARMARLIEIPKNSSLLKIFPNTFNTYVSDLIQNVLGLDASNLNHVLACTPIGNDNAQEFDSFIQHAKTVPITNDEFETKILEALPKWDNTNFFFYPLNLPIVVKGAGFSDFDRAKFKEMGADFKEKDCISEQDIEKLFASALLIDEVQWLKSNPESLKGIESITVLESAPFKGLAAGGHALIVIDGKTTPISLAETIIHEDDHYKNTKRFRGIRLHELKIRKDEKVPANIQHPWFGQTEAPLVSNLLFELSSYGTATSFLLKVWDKEKEKGNLFECIKLVEKFIPYKRDAKLAIKLAKENSKYLNKDGEKWLAEMESLWDTLGEKIHVNIKQITGYLLKSEDQALRKAGEEIKSDYSKI